MKPLNPNFFVLIILLFLFSFCNKNDDQAVVPTTDLIHKPEEHQLISNEGDTIPTGVWLSDNNSKLEHPITIEPTTVRLKKSPRELLAHPNKVLAGQPSIVSITHELESIELGVGEVPLPEKVLAVSKTHLLNQPHPKPVSPSFPDAKALMSIRHISIENGLGSPNSGGAFEDRRGDIWLGSDGGGFSRYDGQYLWKYTVKEGLLSNSGSVKLQDSKGNLWLTSGYNEIGVSYFDGKLITHFTEQGGFRARSIWSIFEDSKGNIWFSTNVGAIKYDGRYFTYLTMAHGLGHDWVYSIYEDKEANLWIGTLKGLYQYNGKKLVTYNEREGIPHPSVYSIKGDSLGGIWLGTGQGACYLKGKTITRYSVEQGLIANYTYALLFDDSNQIWFGTEGGISVFDGTYFRNYSQEEGLSNNSVRDLFQDSDGNIWIGTKGGGINLVSATHNFQHIGRNVINPIITSLFEDKDGKIWMGTYGGEVYVYDGHKISVFTEDHGLIGGSVWSFFQDHRGQIWLGTNKGLSLFNGSRFLNYATNSSGFGKGVIAIMEDSQERLWLGTNTGLVHFDGNQFVPLKFQGKDLGLVSSLDEDQNGNLWLGSKLGVRKVTAGLDSIIYFTEKEGLPDQRVSEIFSDSRGNTWIGTGKGVVCYRGGKFHHVPLKMGWWHHLGYRFWGGFNAIQEVENGEIWISRVRGLSLLRPVKVKETTTPNFSVGEDSLEYKIIDFETSDGLQDIEIMSRCVLLSKKNELWWAGHNGCISINLNEFQLSTEAPTIRLNHIDLNGQFVDFRNLDDESYLTALSHSNDYSKISTDSIIPFFNHPQGLQLPHDLNRLTFYFSAIDWQSIGNVHFSFFLPGIDDRWSAPQAIGQVDYQNLPPGKYKLQVRASGKSNDWSEPYFYAFTIRPPWWHTWLAYTIYGLVIGLLLYAVYRFQLNRQLALQEARRLKELDEAKSRLYTNITHEFRTPITVMLGMVDKMMRHPHDWLSEGGKIAKRNGQQLLHLVNQLLDLARLEDDALQVDFIQSEVISYLAYLVESFSSYAKSKEVSLHFYAELDELFLDYDPDKLLNIVSNLLSNAIKFTPAGGEIVFRVDTEEQASGRFLRIVVKDTGIGIEPEEISQIFSRFYQVDDSTTRQGEGTGVGLALTHELVQLLGGSIEVASQPQRGTTFTLRLPISKEAELVDNTFDREALMVSTKIFQPLKAYPVSQGIIGPRPAEKSNAPLILIIEDNQDLIRFLAACLEQYYALVVASDGQTGIEMAFQHLPDIIISDVMMPKKDGFEVCAILKSDERTSHIPLILLTAKVGQKSKMIGLKKGADAYLPKPFLEDELFLRIRNLLQLRQNFQIHYQAYLKDPREELLPKHTEDTFIVKLRTIIEHNFHDANFDVELLAENLHMHRSTLFKKVKSLTGKSVAKFIVWVRLQKAKELLATTDLIIKEIAYEVGFSAPTKFSRDFKEEYGFSPSEYRHTSRK